MTHTGKAFILIPTELPSKWAPNTGGVGKIGDFRPISRCISETGHRYTVAVFVLVPV